MADKLSIEQEAMETWARHTGDAERQGDTIRRMHTLGRFKNTVNTAVGFHRGVISPENQTRITVAYNKGREGR